MLVLSAGDDVTDETMFACSRDDLHERARQKIIDMVSVKVGAGKTGAKYRVQSPIELRQVISALIQKFSLTNNYGQFPGVGLEHGNGIGGLGAPTGNGSQESPNVAYATVAESVASKPTLDSLFFGGPGPGSGPASGGEMSPQSLPSLPLHTDAAGLSAHLGPGSESPPKESDQSHRS